MARIDVRGLDKDVVNKIDTMASKRGMSRESFVRNILSDLVIEAELKAIENKYENLVHTMMEVIQNNTEELDELAELIKNRRDKEYEKTI